MLGKIKFVKQDRGFGFIETDDGKDFFFHISDLIDPGEFNKVNPDDKVEFDKGTGRDMREKATNVKIIRG